MTDRTLSETAQTTFNIPLQSPGRPHLLLVSLSDCDQDTTRLVETHSVNTILPLSSFEREGLDELKELIN